MSVSEIQLSIFQTKISLVRQKNQGVWTNGKNFFFVQSTEIHKAFAFFFFDLIIGLSFLVNFNSTNFFWTTLNDCKFFFEKTRKLGNFQFLILVFGGEVLFWGLKQWVPAYFDSKISLYSFSLFPSPFPLFWNLPNFFWLRNFSKTNFLTFPIKKEHAPNHCSRLTLGFFFLDWEHFILIPFPSRF